MQVARGSARNRGQDARPNPGDASDRSGRTRREQGARGGIRGNRAGDLFRHSARSRDGRTDHRGQYRRRRRDRDGGREIARKDSTGENRSARRVASLSDPQTGQTAGVRVVAVEGGGEIIRWFVSHVHGLRLLDGGSESARGDARRRGAGARREIQFRRQRPLSAPGTRWRSAISRKKIRARWKHPGTA